MQTLKLYAKNALIGVLVSVLFSNVTFAHAIDFHLCQGEVQSVALFGKKASCGAMMKAQKDAVRSCCDVKTERDGLVIKEKSCCDNVQVVQDNLLDKQGIDLLAVNHFAVDVILNSDFLDFMIEHKTAIVSKVEIPPPPILIYRHTQEQLQVFLI